MAPVLVTGAAGFIGMHVCERLLARGEQVVGVDAFTPYYDPALKRARLETLRHRPGFSFHEIDLADFAAVIRVFDEVAPDRVVHLAAQPGVRASIDDPITSIRANCDGFVTVLEAGRRHGLAHLVYASSSSVYGANRTLPYSTEQSVNHPVSLYAASKKANELMAHTFAHVHKLPVTGLRFFTVYGPWGRPDMAAWLFTRAIFTNEPIRIFNHGDMWRDFTYVDDIVEGVIRTLDHVARPDPAYEAEQPNPGSSSAPYRVYNIGNDQPVQLLRFIELLEQNLGATVGKNLLPMQPGDVPDTWADVSALRRDVGYAPGTSIEDGVARFVKWYREYHGR